MHPEHPLGREALQKAVVEHDLGARLALLGRLEDEVDGALEGARRRQVLGGTEQHRRVAVVAAGVHHPRVLRGVREVGRLVNGQGVHVGAQPDRPALAPALPMHDPDDAGAADLLVHLVDAERAQLIGDECRRLVLLEGQFGVLVQMPPPQGQRVAVGLDLGQGGHSIGLLRRGGRCCAANRRHL